MRLGVVLLAVGFGPLVALQYLFPDANPLVAIFLALSVGPLGAAIFALGLILYLVALFRRPPKAPS